MQFLYFVEGIKGLPNDARLDEVGLADRLSVKGGVSRRECREGPNGKSGLVCSQECEGQEIGYFPAKQEWRECDGYWLGWERDGMPTPDDLMRPEAATMQGYRCMLNDQQWLVPGANPCMTSPMLPARMRPQPDGSDRVEVISKFAGFQAEVAEAFEILVAAKADLDIYSAAMSRDRVWSIARQALAVMYRVTRFEIDALELLTDATAGDVVLASLDYVEIDRIVKEVEQKKTDQKLSAIQTG